MPSSSAARIVSSVGFSAACCSDQPPFQYLISPPAAWNSCTEISSPSRSEEHTSELQSRRDLVCRLLLEKKKNIGIISEKFREVDLISWCGGLIHHKSRMIRIS